MESRIKGCRVGWIAQGTVEVRLSLWSLMDYPQS